MKILVMNCGSSTLKYQLIDMELEEVLAKGLCERIGMKGSAIIYQPKGMSKTKREIQMQDHTQAAAQVIQQLTEKEHGVIGTLSEIDAIGHRVVHGGEAFVKPCLITEEVIQTIEACSDLAPLHNPANLVGIRACQAVMPDTPMVAVFDTAFHQTMPRKAYLYGIPYHYYEENKIRRYGFHGTSHEFVANRAAQIVGKDEKDLKIIVCHLGNGASVCAVDQGRSVDTSMGMTPLEGLIMGTRSGDIDPAIVEFICKKEDKTISEVMNILNKESGVLGISQTSSDYRDLAEEAKEGKEGSKAALEAYAYRIAKYIGAYTAAMNGVDIIVFTAGVGENNSEVRELLNQYLGYLGTNINSEKNQIRGEEVILSDEGSKVLTMVIPTNEELAIARAVKTLV